MWGTGGNPAEFAVDIQAIEGARSGAAAPEPASAPGCSSATPPTISFCTDVPRELLASMAGFIQQHPNWDQYRLFQAALAGFLVQNGLANREVTRCYLANLFPAQADFKAPEPGSDAHFRTVAGRRR